MLKGLNALTANRKSPYPYTPSRLPFPSLHRWSSLVVILPAAGGVSALKNPDASSGPGFAGGLPVGATFCVLFIAWLRLRLWVDLLGFVDIRVLVCVAKGIVWRFVVFCALVRGILLLRTLAKFGVVGVVLLVFFPCFVSFLAPR